VEGSAGVGDIEGVGREVLGVEGIPYSEGVQDWKEFELLLILLKQVVQWFSGLSVWYSSTGASLTTLNFSSTDRN